MTTKTLCGLRAASRSPIFHAHNIQPPKFRSLHRPYLLFKVHTTRHNSTSTSPATRINHNLRVNGPTTTLPAPLVLPVRDPDTRLPVYLYRLGRAYLAFYKTGLKHVWANYKTARTLHRDIIDAKCGGSIQRAVHEGLLTRSDFQLLVRSRRDVKRIPLFALVFVVCGEFTPLVVLFMSSVVPGTCLIPKQVQRAREKAEGRRRVSFRELVTPPPTEDVGVRGVRREQLVHVSRSLGLHSMWWPEGLGLPSDGMLRSSIGRRAEYLEMDDRLIGSDGGVAEMEMEEVKMALEERGLDLLGKNDQQLRGLLRAWLRAREEWPLMTLFLTRPSVWAKTDG